MFLSIKYGHLNNLAQLAWPYLHNLDTLTWPYLHNLDTLSILRITYLNLHSLASQMMVVNDEL